MLPAVGPCFDETSWGFDKAPSGAYIGGLDKFWIVSAMQRVRIGLTGLAFVFIAVLLAAALTSAPAGEAEITPNSIERQSGMQSVPATAPPAGPTEPLAELGVAPGKADSNAIAAPALSR